MTEEEKITRKCLRRKQVKPISDFARTPSKFFPNHHSLICTNCFEIMVPQDNLGEVDRLCRYLDVPFDLNKWTELYAIHKEHTLSAYFNLLLDGTFLFSNIPKFSKCLSNALTKSSEILTILVSSIYSFLIYIFLFSNLIFW